MLRMPPKKKARLSQAASPAPDSAPRTPPPPPNEESSPSDMKPNPPLLPHLPPKPSEPISDDPWTDQEEIGLFKGLLRWKPTGIHKHFRLLALHAWLLDEGYILAKNAHTRPAGLWAKLNTLYHLPTLDAREDARQLPAMENPLLTDEKIGQAADTAAQEDADVYSEAENKIDVEEFSLEVGQGFEEEMWKRRLQNTSEADESEPELPDLNLAEHPPIRFMPSFSIEPSEAATPGSRRGKGWKRGKPAAATRRSARQAESTADEEEQGEGKPKEEGDEDEEEASVSEQASQASTPAPRATRTSKCTRGRAKGRARGRSRR